LYLNEPSLPAISPQQTGREREREREREMEIKEQEWNRGEDM
jgi:hypothetical protein